MAATSASLAPARRRWRSAIARHPVAAMLILMFVIGWALLIPPALAGIPLEPFPLLAAVLFAQLLPAVLVTAAVGGRRSAAGPRYASSSAACSAGECACAGISSRCSRSP